MGTLLLVEIVLAFLAFIFSAKIREKVSEILQVEGLIMYRDDDDLRNLIDWMQQTVSVTQGSRVAGCAASCNIYRLTRDRPDRGATDCSKTPDSTSPEFSFLNCRKPRKCVL